MYTMLINALQLTNLSIHVFLPLFAIFSTHCTVCTFYVHIKHLHFTDVVYNNALFIDQLCFGLIMNQIPTVMGLLKRVYLIINKYNKQVCARL